jgi:DNA replication protein DnaC
MRICLREWRHEHQRIDELCQELRLGALASLYGPIAQDAARRKNASYADFLEEALRAERDARRVRSREMLTRTAGFPAIKTLEDYDFGFATGAPRGQILELAVNAGAKPGHGTGVKVVTELCGRLKQESPFAKGLSCF